jgi:hypothetical protein
MPENSESREARLGTHCWPVGQLLASSEQDTCDAEVVAIAGIHAVTDTGIPANITAINTTVLDDLGIRFLSLWTSLHSLYIC